MFSRTLFLGSLAMIGVSALGLSPAPAESATSEQRAVLSAICEKSDITGLNCERARNYPRPGTCNVELTGGFYTLGDRVRTGLLWYHTSAIVNLISLISGAPSF